MSLPHVLLGMLAEPASGYELKQFFDQSVRHFWSAELSQIYPALTKLEKEGLLSSNSAPSDKGPSRKMYRRTAAGKTALHDWLVDGPQCRTERLSYLTQVFFLDAIDPAQRIRFMEELKADFAARLQALKAIEQNWGENDPRYPEQLPDKDFYPQMTLRAGLMKYQLMVDWCQECLDRMQKRPVIN